MEMSLRQQGWTCVGSGLVALCVVHGLCTLQQQQQQHTQPIAPTWQPLVVPSLYAYVLMCHSLLPLCAESLSAATLASIPPHPPTPHKQTFVVLPIADLSVVAPERKGLSEDTLDTLFMIASRPLLQVLLLVYTGSLQAYNICGMVTAGGDGLC